MSSDATLPVDRARATIRSILSAYSGAKRARVALAFSGGKDSIVLLHLVTDELAKASSVSGSPGRPTLVYFDVAPQTAFDDTLEAVELRAHISGTLRDPVYTAFFDTAIVGHSTSLRQSVATFVGEPSRFDLIFMGTRQTDPAGATLREPLVPTSSDWPRFLRAMPLLTWTNRDIWAYIDAHGLPYPGLYSRGFTSIGDTRTDRPHPALYNHDTGAYRHARELVDTADERAGRVAVTH
jgi:3'-phosphoadenosine 5'-phosphosulfate sulfotransferase (PAPS reductase)/FAD synthetase